VLALCLWLVSVCAVRVLGPVSGPGPVRWAWALGWACALELGRRRARSRARAGLASPALPWLWLQASVALRVLTCPLGPVLWHLDLSAWRFALALSRP